MTLGIISLLVATCMRFTLDKIRVLSAIPGRVRVHLPGWKGNDRERLESQLLRVEGVESVQPNPRTENVLIHFDRRMTEENRLLRELDEIWGSLAHSERVASRTGPLHLHTTAIRVGVRGLLGHAVVDSIWFGAGFLGKFIGLPLAWLGPLHVLMDIAVWTFALRTANQSSVPRPPRTREGRASQIGLQPRVKSLA